MRAVVFLSLVVSIVCRLQAAEPCITIHGRASLYSGDFQLRIWQVGTHHEFEPDESSWVRVLEWLNAGAGESDKHQHSIPASTVYLFGDFLVCPVEPLKKGWVQHAEVKSVLHRRYVRIN